MKNVDLYHFEINKFFSIQVTQKIKKHKIQNKTVFSIKNMYNCFFFNEKHFFDNPVLSTLQATAVPYLQQSCQSIVNLLL